MRKLKLRNTVTVSMETSRFDGKEPEELVLGGHLERNHILYRHGWHMNRGMSEANFGIPLLRIAVHHIAIPKVWHLATGGCHIRETFRLPS